MAVRVRVFLAHIEQRDFAPLEQCAAHVFE
jgi:hypothetical protein